MPFQHMAPVRISEVDVKGLVCYKVRVQTGLLSPHH